MSSTRYKYELGQLVAVERRTMLEDDPQHALGARRASERAHVLVVRVAPVALDKLICHN